jgi:N-carbamoyl-L-amino-acid hydrolase
MRVDLDRLRRDINSNSEFGKIDTERGNGRTVLTGTAADKRARDYFVDQLERAGLDVRIDAVGNIAGRWSPASADDDKKPVATGSHLDSVLRGGMFDGVLGVYASLEAVRTMQSTDFEPQRPIEVVSFTGEEGQRFETPLLGSKVATNAFDLRDALALTDEDGETLENALSSIGYHGSGALYPSNWDAWVEVHIEQGSRLEDQNVPVGVVNRISGLAQCDVDIVGQSEHAGTTSMDARRDALTAASEFILAVEDAPNELPETSAETAVATVGRATVEPNSTNVIPGRVNVGLDLRDTEHENITTLLRHSRDTLAEIERQRGVTTEFDQYFRVEPEPLSDRCINVIQRAGRSMGYEVSTGHSGAGHDTMSVSRVTDAGLIFAPSKRGFSHSPREWTDWEDCARVTQVLEESLRTFASS